MGRVKAELGQRVYLDTNIVIDAVEGIAIRENSQTYAD